MTHRFLIGRKAAAALGLAAMLGAAPAFAADVIGIEPPSPQPLPFENTPVASWAGGYAGIQGGYNFSGETTVGNNAIDTDGFNGGVFGGWNGQSGLFVYGLEGDVGLDGSEGSNAGVSVDHGFNGSLRARMGVAATDNILVYGTAGGAAANVEVSDGVATDDKTMLGWTAGVGADVKLTEQIFARGEYRYTDLGSENFALSGGGTDVDATSNNFLLGLGFKF
jgi:outer membrane immunogenic protein